MAKTLEENIAYQKKLRIVLTMAAYAYEYDNTFIMSDTLFDELCLKVDTSILTGNEKMDNFFQKEFDPSTGMWVRNHPEMNKVIALYRKYYEGRDITSFDD